LFINNMLNAIYRILAWLCSVLLLLLLLSFSTVWYQCTFCSTACFWLLHIANTLFTHTYACIYQL